MLIYLIRNKINGKCYVGQTKTSIKERISSHLSCSKHRRYIYKPLYDDINKFGWEMFEVETLCECESFSDLNNKEQCYIDIYDSYNNGYNLTRGGSGCHGHKVSDETKKKISAFNKGKVISDEHRRKISQNNSMYREECRRKVSDSMKDRVLSDETKKKISDFNKGKTLSDETKQKISDSSKGRIVSDKTREKLSASSKLSLTQETREKLDLPSTRIKANKGIIWKVTKDGVSKLYPSFRYFAYDIGVPNLQHRGRTYYKGYVIDKITSEGIDIYQWDGDKL